MMLQITLYNTNREIVFARTAGERDGGAAMAQGGAGPGGLGRTGRWPLGWQGV